MFPHTPHVESVSLLSLAPVELAPRAADVAPEQVGVRQEEAEADGRERREAGDAVPGPDEDERRGEARASSRSTSRATRRPKRSAAARKSAKKTMSGGPMFTVAVSPGVGNATATLLEDPGLLLDDVLGRAGRDRPDVDPRDEHRDEREPPQLLEEREEPEADERDSTRAWRRSPRSRAPRSERATARAPAPSASTRSGFVPPGEREREPDRGRERRERRRRRGTRRRGRTAARGGGARPAP